MVKSFLPPVRLQRFQPLQDAAGDWLIGLEVYPCQSDWILGQEAEKGLVLRPWPKREWPGEPKTHPVSLYLRAHAVNQRIVHWERQTDYIWSWTLEPSGTTVHLSLEGGKLKVICALGPRAEIRKRPRQDFAAELPLARFYYGGEGGETQVRASPKPPTVGQRQIESKAVQKHERLLANIQGDLDVARKEAEAWAEVWEFLKLHPRAFESAEAWPDSARSTVEAAIAEGELPSWGPSSVGPASRAVFDRKRRVERRIEGAQKRLREIERRGVPGERAPARPPGRGRPESPPQASQRPSKRPGIWVELATDLWARVGRSSNENDELFRQARDRDLWFHVRGQSGSHVWIPRGQKGFGACDEPGEHILAAGCQLALMNSQAVRSGFAVVDVTERRYLKKIQGQAGGVQILRSDTRSTHLDEGFEKRILKK